MFLIMAVIGVYTNILAQAPDTLWTRTYGRGVGSSGTSVQQTRDGGYIVLGNTLLYGAHQADILLIKTNSFGDTLWMKTYGGNRADYGYFVQETRFGGYIIVGSTGSNVWLIKTNALGDVLWTNKIGGAESGTGFCVRQTIDGGYIVSGYTSSFGAGNTDVWLIRTDTLGNTVWTKTYGGNRYEEGWSVLQSTDGGYIIAGSTSSFKEGYNDVWLIKTNSSGDTLWTKTYGGSQDEHSFSVQQTTDGGYILTGYTTSYAVGGIDFWLVKTDSLGETLWTRAYGGYGDEIAVGVQQTLDGGYILTGTTSLSLSTGDVWIVKTDSSGDTLWTKTIRGSGQERSSSIQQTSDGGYIIAGTTNSNVWLIRLASEVVGVAEESGIFPNNFTLYRNYPNPFNPVTTIEYSIPSSGDVILTIYNLLGEEITRLVDGHRPAGEHQSTWNASNVSSGIYFYRLQAGDFVQTRKMVLLK